MAIPIKVIALFLAGLLYLDLQAGIGFEQKPAHYVLPSAGLTAAAGSAATNPAAANPAAALHFEANWVSSQETQEAHSANIAIFDGAPIAVWYGGTEEGHADVALFISTLVDEWSPPHAFVDRASTEAGLDRFIRKIGNPAIHVWPDGAIGVFYVSVSIGGWGASTINYLESRDGGWTWTEPKRLVTSPFLNISTLVRTQPLVRSDGSIELPVYHEFIGKFSESLHLKRDLTILGKHRISWGKHSLQPAIAPLTPSDSLALLRYAGAPPGHVLVSKSSNTGQQWNTPEPTNLPNPNSAVAVLNLGDGRLLMALNDTEDDRYRLSLALGSADKEGWRVIKVLEEEANTAEEEFEFSYPSITRDESGLIHVVYTWNQKRIRHMAFNTAWLTSEPVH